MISVVEVFAIFGAIGGLIGYSLRDKTNKNGKAIGISIGIVSSIVVTYLLVIYVFQSIIAMPVYGAFGAWFSMKIYRKTLKEED